MTLSSRRPLISVLFLSLALLILAGCAGPAEEEATAEQEPEAAATESVAAPAETSAAAPATVGEEVPAATEAGLPPGMVLMPAGHQMEVKLLTALSTRDTQPGAPFEAKVRGAQWFENKKVPLGKWTVLGTVTAVNKPQAKKDLPGEMELSFHTVITDTGDEYAMEAFASDFAGDTKKRNIGVIAGAAAIGAIMGKKAGGDTKDAVIGAAAGAAVGAGAVRALPGKHLVLDEGTEMVITVVSDTPLPYIEP